MPLNVLKPDAFTEDLTKYSKKFELRFSEIQKIITSNDGLIVYHNSYDRDLNHELKLYFVYKNIYDDSTQLKNTLSPFVPVQTVNLIPVTQDEANEKLRDNILRWGCSVLLGIAVFCLSSSFNKPQLTPVQAPVATSQTQSDNAGEVSGSMCVENFNRQMSPAAYATLDKGTKTVSITLSSGTASEQEVESLANSVASSIFSSCTDVFVQTVSISNGSSVVTKHR